MVLTCITNKTYHRMVASHLLKAKMTFLIAVSLCFVK